MRAAMMVSVIGATCGTAMAGPQFAALDFGSASPNSIAAITPTGEGTKTVGLTGDLGPFYPGPFTVSFSLSFDSYSVPGDGVAAIFSILPTFSAGTLEMKSFSLSAALYDGANEVSMLASQGQVSQGASSGSQIDAFGLAQAFSRNGAAPFEYIGDHGYIMVSMSFLWTGASSTQTLDLEVLEGSEIQYLTFIPAPGVVGVLGAAGAVFGVRRRRTA